MASSLVELANGSPVQNVAAYIVIFAVALLILERQVLSRRRLGTLPIPVCGHSLNFKDVMS